jgi:HAD superfamily hydrolase (TIGR01490 family)
MTTSPTRPVVAFFDLDGTLLTVNSGALWIQRERRLGRISALQFAKAGLWLLAYRLRPVDMTRLTELALETIIGEAEDTVRRWTREWYAAEVAHHVSAEARACVERHRIDNHRLILLTSSSRYESECACEQLGLDGYLCTRYEVVDGRFTGRVVRPVCYGEGKVALAAAWAAEQGCSLADAFFYTDSHSDLPGLEAVGRPRVVNPDLRLRLSAWRRGWPVLTWGPRR